MRRLALALAFCTLAPWAGSAAGNGELISESVAARCGLARPWIAQVQIDRSQGRVRDIILYEGTLYTQSTRAMLSAIDAETGRTLWSKQVGRPDHPSMTPGAYRDLLATVNGSRLFVVNRFNGDILYEAPTNGSPGGGPALSSKRCYVPTVGGLMQAYRIEPLTDPLRELGKIGKAEPSEEEKKVLEEERRQNIRVRQDWVPPMACQSSGRVLAAPTVTFQSRDEEFCAWGTDRGWLHIGRIDRMLENNLVMHREKQTGASIVAPPSYLPPDPKVLGDSGTVYVTSCDGYVYAFVEKTGEQLWRFSAGEPVVESAAVIEDRVFASTQFGGMFCLDGKSGRQLWWAPEVRRFLAAGRERVYAADKVGRVRILDGKTGTLVDTLPAESLPLKLTNTATDRLYLGTETGALECLHEIEQQKPLHYGESRKLPPDDVLPKLPKSKAGEAGTKPKAKSAKPKTHPKPKAPAKAKDKVDEGDNGLGDDAPVDDKPKKDKKPPKKIVPKKTPKGKDADNQEDPFNNP